MTTLFIVMLTFAIVISFTVGYYTCKDRHKKLKDRFNPKEKRTPKQLGNDAVLQLSNEIAPFVMIKELPNGEYEVSLTVVK